jgi:outer membrane protein TolC
MTTPELVSFSQDKRDRVTIDQEPISGPVGLYEAMARALKYNLDQRVELMDIALKNQQLQVAHYSLLPGVVANSGYVDRNNYSGGNSVELLGSNTTGAESLRSSTSSEKDVRSADLSMSWHVLDFGLSYVRAKQAADEVLISREKRRKVINRIIEDVRSAYWKAVAAERTLAGLRKLSRRVKRALSDSRKLAERAEASPLTALTYERELREIQREINGLQGDLVTAKAQLAALINVEPGTEFRLAIPSRIRPPKRIKLGAGEMISTALMARSELREVAYRSRINENEAHAAVLQMLPGISFTAAPNFNSNDFLFNKHWLSWGARASWNLINVFNYPARKAEVMARDDLLDARALAVTMAVMTQVHVSRARLVHARRKYRAATDFYDVQWRIARQIRSSLTAGKVSEQTAIREEMNTLVARVKRDLAFVELQNAFANVYASMGMDPFEDDFVSQNDPVSHLEAILRQRWRALGDQNA